MARKVLLVGAVMASLLGSDLSSAQNLPAPSRPLTGSERVRCIQNNAFKDCTPDDLGKSTVARQLGLVSVTAAGADPTGVSDSTAAFNTALASGSLAIFVPPGTYKVCGVTMPSTMYVVLFGAGTSSKLVQGSCGKPAIGWSTTGMVWPNQRITDLSFDGTAGTADTLSTAGAGNVSLHNLYFNGVPVGYSSILVNGASGTYTHDIRIDDVSIYSSTGNGYAGIHLGALTADTKISNVLLGGAFVVNYGIVGDSGGIGVAVSDSHIYNLKNNALLLNGVGWFQSDNVTWDNAQGAVVSINGSSNVNFAGGYIEAINAGQSGIVINNTNGTQLLGVTFEASSGATSAVTETGTSDYTNVIGGSISTLANYSNAINLTGNHSNCFMMPAVCSSGFPWAMNGLTSSAITPTSATPVFLGPNGGNTAENRATFLVPWTMAPTSGYVAVDTAPASGQSYTFTFLGGLTGTTTLGTCTIPYSASNQAFSCTAALSGSLNPNDMVSIQAVATAGSFNARYIIHFKGQ